MTTLCDHPRIHWSNHRLSDGNAVLTGLVPDELVPDERFDDVWALMPPEPQRIRIARRWVEIPRRQTAFLHDYTFSGQTSRADEASLSDVLVSYLEWARGAIDDRLNGLLLNWYDGQHRQYIGPHRDDTRQLVRGSPIVTISLGQERIFRLTREEKRNGKKLVVDKRDFVVESGSVIILPWETNLVGSIRCRTEKATCRERLAPTCGFFRGKLKSRPVVKRWQLA